MIIIFGSRMYGKKDEVLGWGYCDHCNKFVKHSSYNARKWGHLYYIPLIPSGSRVRVVKECAECKNGMHIPEAEVPGVFLDIQETVKASLSALLEGHTKIQEEGSDDALDCAAYLYGTLDMLYCLNEKEYADQILATLQENDLRYEYCIVKGSSLEFYGMFDEAAMSYKQAIEMNPEDPIPLFLLGSLYLNQNNVENARGIFEQALELAPGDLSVMQALIDIYSAMQEHYKVAEMYERCFELVPGLTQDKKIVKVYKKACKKAGKDPMTA
jgi:tetratricopeptide (TPR) repeat protein